MKWLRLYAGKTYLFKMLISIGLLSIFVVVLSSTVLFYKSRNTLLNMQHESNRKMLEQVGYNIDFTDRMLTNLITSTYFDPRTAYLLDTAQPEEFKLYASIMSFEKLLNSVPLLQSVTVYNARNGCYYYYSEAKVLNCKDDGTDGKLDRYLKRADNVPKLQLVPIYYGESDRRISHFSFFMYSNSNGTLLGSGSSALFFNIKPEWLFANVSEINRLTEYSDSHLLIIDGSGNIVNDLSGNGSWNRLRERIDMMRRTEGDSRSFIDTNDGLTRLVTYVPSLKNDWTIVSVQPYDAVFQVIREMKAFAVISVAVVLLLTAATSALLASRLYNPVSGVLRLIRKDADLGGTQPAGKRDEFGVISTVLQRTITEMRSLRQQQDSQSGILRSYYVRQLLLDSPHVSPDDAAEKLGIGRNRGMRYTICMFKLDDYALFLQGNRPEDRRLYTFSIGNIMQEIVSKSVSGDVIDTGEDRFVALLYEEPSDDEDDARIRRLATDVQETVMKYYKLSLTAVYADPVTDYRQIARLYKTVEEYAKYRFVFGKQSIITPASVRLSGENEADGVPAGLEKSWIAAIRAQDPDGSEGCLTELFEHIARCRYDQMVNVLLALAAEAAHAIGSASGDAGSTDVRSVYKRILEKETLGEVRELFISLFHTRSRADSQGASESSKRQMLVGTIKQIVEARYTDPSLCLQSVADMVNLSPSYVGKQFRDEEELSVAKYITSVRMKHAADLLAHTDSSVNAIMEKVGFVNQSYFFKLFKQHFGLTPNEYKTDYSGKNG